MGDMIPVRITSSDVDSVASKLDQLAAGMTSSEQAVLGWVLQRAAEAPADPAEVQGYQGQFLTAPSNFNFQSSAFSFQHSLGFASLSGGVRPGQINSWSATVSVCG
jgi:hypothetical protein